MGWLWWSGLAWIGCGRLGWHGLGQWFRLAWVGYSGKAGLSRIWWAVLGWVEFGGCSGPGWNGLVLGWVGVGWV